MGQRRMRILLDTDAMSHVIKADVPELSARVMGTPIHDRYTSSISLGELLYGFEKTGRHEHLRGFSMRSFCRRSRFSPLMRLRRVNTRS